MNAQDAPLAKPRRPAPAATAPDATAASTPASGPDVASARVAPLPDGDGFGAGPPAAAAPTLRSAVRSRWSAPAFIASRGGGACRAECATSRLACLAPGIEEEIARCNAAWTGCLSTCAGLAYGRAPPAP